MGFEIESSHHEHAPAQHEIDFKEADALTMAKLHNKVTLYGIAAKKDYGFIRPLYPEVSVWRSPLELKKKLLLTLASWHLDSLVYRIIHHFIL